MHTSNNRRTLPRHTPTLDNSPLSGLSSPASILVTSVEFLRVVPSNFCSRLQLQVALLIGALELLCSSSERTSEISVWLPAPPFAIVVVHVLSNTQIS